MRNNDGGACSDCAGRHHDGYCTWLQLASTWPTLCFSCHDTAVPAHHQTSEIQEVSPAPVSLEDIGTWVESDAFLDGSSPSGHAATVAEDGTPYVTLGDDDLPSNASHLLDASVTIEEPAVADEQARLVCEG